VGILIAIPAFSETELQPAGGVETFSDWEGLGHTAAAKPTVTDTLWMSTIGAATAILAVLRAVMNATILLPWFLSSLLHIPKSNPLIMMFTALVWINYGLGALQIWMRTSIKHME